MEATQQSVGHMIPAFSLAAGIVSLGGESAVF